MPSGHPQQSTAQVRPAGPRPLAPIPFDVEAAFPELTGSAREVTLLYPRAGRPGPGDSSLGGPLLWPADEPWPMCAEPDHYKPLSPPVGPEPVAMLPVVQLYARDVPGLVFPAGTDLLQILWCPLVHGAAPYAAAPGCAGAARRRRPRVPSSGNRPARTPSRRTSCPARARCPPHRRWSTRTGTCPRGSAICSTSGSRPFGRNGATATSRWPPRSRAKSAATRGGPSSRTGPTARAAAPGWNTCSASPRPNRARAVGFPGRPGPPPGGGRDRVVAGRGGPGRPGRVRARHVPGRLGRHVLLRLSQLPGHPVRPPLRLLTTGPTGGSAGRYQASCEISSATTAHASAAGSISGK